ncbi:MAG: DUF92 domain-containing protein [Ardenticatenaceae bacterium]|nr:DUF92 domain-containing protein [Ardenticatenaceae bacterium]
MSKLLIGLFISAVIGGVGYQRASLSRSGVLGAIVLGTAIMGIGGWSWGVLLVWFFVSSTLLSKYKAEQKRVTAEKFDKGHERDFGQAMANGGLGAILSLGLLWNGEAVWFAAYIGAIGAVTADTWATELGTLSKQLPRLITSGKVVPPGTSGGITLLGTGVAACGGLLTGLLGGLLDPALLPWQGLLVGLIGGAGGALFDSLLGATVQAIYLSPITGQETEKLIDKGEPTQFLRGWRWLNNDWVNFLASGFGAILAVLVFLLF